VSSELARRVAFGVVAAPIAIAIVIYGGAPLAALLAVASALGAWEFFRIARASSQTPFDDVGIALAGLLPLLVHARYLQLYDPNGRLSAVEIAAVVMLALLTLAIWRRGVAGKPMSAVGSTLLGIAYTGGMLSFGYAIRYHEYAFAPASLSLGGKSFAIPSGGLLLLLPLITTWASDTGAYAVGRALGRRKLIPAVSPGKTVEGAIGGLLASMLVAWVFTQFLLRPAAQLDFRWRPLGAIAVGAVISVAAQLGDLAESLFKREAGVKDASNIIPGHGGVLDRVDSLLFVLPVSFIVFGWLLTWAPA
jgi:phosphatidate cytidylyltransferase